MLLELVKQDTELRRASKKEYHGPCPWCGGHDRFVVFANEDRYWCRGGEKGGAGCGKKGDAIQYLRDYKGMSFQEAKIYVGKSGIYVPKPIKTTPSWKTKQKIRVGPKQSNQKPKPCAVTIYEDTTATPEDSYTEIFPHMEDPNHDTVMVDPDPDPQAVSQNFEQRDETRPTWPEEGFCCKGQHFCPDFTYHRRSRTEKCRLNCLDPAGLDIDLLTECPNPEITKGLEIDRQNNDVHRPDHSDNPGFLDRMEGAFQNAKIVYPSAVDRNRSGLTGIYFEVEDNSPT